MASHSHLLEKAVKLHRANQYQKAADLYRRILRADKRHGDARHLLGVIAHQTGDDATAISHIHAAIAIHGDVPEYHNNLANALSRLERKTEAIAAYWRAIELRPHYFEALLNLGTVLREVHRPEEGARALRMAIALEPKHPDAHLRLAHCLEALGLIDQAVEEYMRTLALRPDDAAAYHNLGGSLFKSGYVAEAELALDRALALKPDMHAARSQRAAALNYRADVTARQVAEAHLEWGRIHARPLTEAARQTAAPLLGALDPERRLRVGYISPNFNRHSVSHFFLPVLRQRAREQFEVFLYSVSRLTDETSDALRESADGWRDAAALSDEKLAALVRADGIDILVDLVGHTGYHRLLVFARKPAPVQVTWLGYPQTTGVEAIDYRLTDAITDPPGEADELSAETLVRLPNGFHCFGRPGEEPGDGCEAGPPPVTPLPARANGFVTFGSFNTVQKMSPALVALWARVLRAVPGSRLLLKSLPDVVVGERFTKLFAEEGVAPERVEFLHTTASRSGHLALYGRMDIALDTFPYHGTTTTCEALWMGVPVLTLCGDRHASRVGASLLTRVGLEDWIARDEEEYLAQAVQRAGALDALAELRASLRERMRHSPLCDAAGFTRDLEAAYRDLWRRHCAGAAVQPQKD